MFFGVTHCPTSLNRICSEVGMMCSSRLNRSAQDQSDRERVTDVCVVSSVSSVCVYGHRNEAGRVHHPPEAHDLRSARGETRLLLVLLCLLVSADCRRHRCSVSSVYDCSDGVFAAVSERAAGLHCGHAHAD